MTDHSVRQIALKPCFANPVLDVMNVLNETMLDFPQAISFGPGRPPERFFGLPERLGSLAAFVGHRSGEAGPPEAATWDQLGQYGRTNGFISEQISRQLANDEGIHVPAKAIVATVGAHEAMALLLLGIFEPSRDILLTSDPTYIGITGLAQVLGITTVAIECDEDGLDPVKVEHTSSRFPARVVFEHV